MQLWRDFAVNYFCDGEPFDRHIGCEELFIEKVLKLATHDIDAAIKYMCDYPDFFDLGKYFDKLTEHGQEMAVDCICQQIDTSSTCSECCQDIILGCAIEGSARCQIVVYNNPQMPLFQGFIWDEAQLGDGNALGAIYAHPEIDDFRDYILQQAKAGDADARKAIYDAGEKLQEKTDSAMAKIFRGFIVSEARKNVERALKCVEADAQNEEYKGFLIEKCLEKDEWALTIICNNSDYYGSWINETIKSRCDKNDLKELLVEKILHRAKSDDNALKYVVCENPQEEKFKNLVVEKIQQNKDAFECIYQYYSRETSSNFSEFVKQRILKEFGIRYECDDNTLKNAIGLLQSDYFKYFVLAVALDGNELALATVRKAFLDFSHIIVESLNSGNPQDRRYMVECVNSDTVGKLIRELAGNGNGEAIKILQMA